MVLHIKKKRMVVRVRKSTVRFILFVYLGDLGDWKQFKYSETVHTIMDMQKESGLAAPQKLFRG